MNPNEFKAWIDGFSQAVGDAPTAEQWALVKAKVNELASPLGNLTFPQGKRGDMSPNFAAVSGNFAGMKVNGI